MEMAPRRLTEQMDSDMVETLRDGLPVHNREAESLANICGAKLSVQLTVNGANEGWASVQWPQSHSAANSHTPTVKFKFEMTFLSN